MPVSAFASDRRARARQRLAVSSVLAAARAFRGAGGAVAVVLAATPEDRAAFRASSPVGFSFLARNQSKFRVHNARTKRCRRLVNEQLLLERSVKEK